MLRFAVGNLLSRPLRSLLSLIGLAIAIGGMVALFAIAGGIDHVVSRTFEQIPGLLVQQKGAPIPLFSSLPASWGNEIAQLHGVQVVDPQVVTRVNLIGNKTIISPPRFLVGVDLPTRDRLQHDIYRANIVSGRSLNAEDVGTNHCMVSQQLAEEYGKQVGDTIRLNRFECKIVGIYNTGSIMLDVNILMDMKAVRDYSRVALDTVACFYVEAEPGADKRALKHRIEALFADRDIDAWRLDLLGGSDSTSGKLISGMLRLLGTAPQGSQTSSTESAPSKEGEGAQASQAKPATGADAPSSDANAESAVEVRMAEDWSERFAEFSGDLDLFLGLITAIGVLIAVLSIVNTMMMSVTERTIEFGILRANGWSQRNIMQLMTLEAGLLGVLGGAVGVTLGWMATLAVNWRWPDRLQLYASPQLLIFGILFSTTIGILGGLYPAWIAARMSPMESIRRG